MPIALPAEFHEAARISQISASGPRNVHINHATILHYKFDDDTHTSMKSFLTLALAVVLSMILSACGGGDGPVLGTFPDLAKNEGDAAFPLTAPSSKGPGAFSYTSSNTEVATISGNMVTITGAGTSTITATQAASGSFNSSSTSAVLTVTGRPCIAPATRQHGTCTAPATSGTVVTAGGHTWMPVMHVDVWTNANSYCTTTTINGTKGWRLPTEFELTELRTSGAMKDHGWTLARTWSATAGALTGQRKTVKLDDGVIGDETESNSAYVACLM
jgi:hypothetical protein